MISVVIRLDRLLLFWTGLILAFAGFAAPAFASSVWFTRVWSTDDGLMNNQVEAIVQGPDDFLWVVFPAGLMRFDGVRFSPFPLESFTGATDDHISAALCDRAGTLWFATYRGTVIGIKPDFSVVKIPKASLPNGLPWELADDGAGTLWLAYSTNAVCRVKDGRVEQFGAHEGLPAGHWRSFICDGAGDIWLAKGNQVCVFRNGQFREITTAGEPESLAATPTNAVWLVAGEHLYTCDTDGALRDHGIFPGLSSATRALLEDHTGAVWIGTEGDGLIRYGESGFEKIATPYPFILAITEDREGNIWAGTAGGGLDRISLSGVRLEDVENKSIAEQAQSICEDTNGSLWGVAYSGWPYDGMLTYCIDDNWSPFLPNAPSAGSVTCVAADHSGGIWIGTRNGKLLHLVNTNCPVLAQTTSHGAIDALLPTLSGDLWIVAYRSLQRLHDGQLQDFKLPRPLGKISAIAEDAAGNLWVGAGNIILRYDGRHFTDETQCLPVSGREICCLYGTADGSMWISGGGLGLLRFKNGRVDQIGLDQGLFDDHISQIVADNQGWLWFGSDHGIFKIRQRELEQAMDNHSVRLRPVAYGRNEGLSSLSALFSTGVPYSLPQAIRTHDGRVLLLTHTGIVVADPKLLPANSTPPPVLLTRLAMDGQTIASYGGVAPTQTIANLKTLNAPLQLPPGYRHLEIDYTALCYSAPENIHFRYQLAGFDSDWIDAAGERHADYSRLTAGNYQFRVKACIGDGPWNETAATLDFSVAPYYWQTWWFRLCVLLIFTSSVIAIMRYVSLRRMRRKLRAAEQQAAIEKERGRIARDIHDDLGNRLTEIQLLSGLAQDNRAMPDHSIDEKISAAAQKATDALDEIVWAINPRNDTLPHLIDYLGEFAMEFLQTAGIRCHMDLPEQPPAKRVSAEVRHNLFLVIKESLNNIVQHAGATEGSLTILVTDETIRVIIEDNGHGFNGEANNNGADGLKNMRQRMAEIGGQIHIKSGPESGTRVSFSGPWLAKK